VTFSGPRPPPCGRKAGPMSPPRPADRFGYWPLGLMFPQCFAIAVGGPCQGVHPAFHVPYHLIEREGLFVRGQATSAPTGRIVSVTGSYAHRIGVVRVSSVCIRTCFLVSPLGGYNRARDSLRACLVMSNRVWFRTLYLIKTTYPSDLSDNRFADLVSFTEIPRHITACVALALVVEPGG